MKTCTKCGVEKSATAEYFHRKPTAKDGFAPHCKDCVSECKAQYYARPEIKDHRNERCRQKMKDNPQFAMRENIRTRISRALKGARKDSRTDELVGGIENYKRHIESLWEPGMSWDNHTLDGWHIDHREPISSFDLTDPEQQKICFHYLNCQPLWAKDNLSKGGKTINNF